MSTPRWQVYSADCCGSWEVAAYDSPAEALARVEVERARKPGNFHGVYDEVNPERGDITGELETMEPCEDCDYLLYGCTLERWEPALCHTCRGARKQRNGVAW